MPEEEKLTITKDNIACPKCGWIQKAVVVKRPEWPFPNYTHICKKCEYIITESEWNSRIEGVHFCKKEEPSMPEEESELREAAERMLREYGIEEGQNIAYSQADVIDVLAFALARDREYWKAEIAKLKEQLKTYSNHVGKLNDNLIRRKSRVRK